MLSARRVGAFELGHLDLVVEVADVADDGLVLHLAHVLERDDVDVAGGGDVDVAAAERVLDRGDLVAFHRGLQGVDGVDLGDDDARAEAAERLGRALADVAVAADDRDLAGDHDVGGALDAVDERLAAAVEVVELGLGHGVVDVDGGDEQLALLEHLVEAVNAGGGLLGDAAPVLRNAVPALRIVGKDVLEELLDDSFFDRAGLAVDEAAVAVLELVALVDQQGDVAAVVDDELRAEAAFVAERLIGAPPVLLERLALPGEDGDAGGGDGGGGVVLRGEDVARGPADRGAELDQRLDEHGGLDGHVQRAGDAHALAAASTARTWRGSTSGRASPARRS